jgi:hypothetical protein
MDKKIAIKRMRTIGQIKKLNEIKYSRMKLKQKINQEKD